MGYIPAPSAAWRGILKLPPGHFSVCEDRLGMPQRWYSLPEAADGDEPTLEDVAATLRKAVEARLVADVPLGVLLSGGLDSAIVTALAAEAVGDAAEIDAFTACFDDPRYDERQLAQATAERIGVRHRMMKVSHPSDDTIVDMLDHCDEPFADSSVIPTWLICREASSSVKVALTGDGGDEVFSGYDRYRAMHLAEHMGSWRYAMVRTAARIIGPIAPSHPRSRLRRLVRFAEGLRYPPAMQYFTYRSLLGAAEVAKLFRPEVLEQEAVRDPMDWFCSVYEEQAADGEAEAARRMDLATYLPDDLLVKADMASMRASLELRSPFLDFRVLDVAGRVPVEQRIEGRRGKALLREMFQGRLPDEVLAGGKKGFGVPLAEWLRGPLEGLVRDWVLETEFTDAAGLRDEAVAAIAGEHLFREADHSELLWALLVLARWFQRHG